MPSSLAMYVSTASTHCAYPHRDGQTELIWVTWLNTETVYMVIFGDRRFETASPRLWNSLPARLRQTDIGCEQFKRLLKTYLFACWDRIFFTYLLTYLLANHSITEAQHRTTVLIKTNAMHHHQTCSQGHHMQGQGQGQGLDLQGKAKDLILEDKTNISLPLCQNLIVDIFQFLNVSSVTFLKHSVMLWLHS